MKTKELKKTIELLINDVNWDSINHYTAQKLEELALYLYNNKGKYPKDELYSLLDLILLERVHKMNKKFEWTEENKQKFITINYNFINIFENAYNEALKIAETLEKRIKNNDSFIKDYEIEIQIQPYIKDKENYENIDGCFALVLCEPLSSFYPINYNIGHSCYEKKLTETPIYLDKSSNRNLEHCFGRTFENEYIGNAIHDLQDNKWSFFDIINIKRIFTDVKVYHQNFIDIGCAGVSGTENP